MKLTALIPAYNDDYVLSFCLAAAVGHFDEIIVLDDASTDDTPDVAADFARQHRNVRFLRHEGRQLGWVGARNRLLAETDSDHLFWLDSDDVLCEFQAEMLGQIPGGHPIVRLCLAEMWGDFYHTTKRLRHHDACHVYVNRKLCPDMIWTGGGMARLRPRAAVRATNGPGPLLFHIKGVKPDRRLVERQRIRPYLRRQDRPDRLDEFMRIDDMTEKEIHARAMRMLLHSKIDRLVPTYKVSDPYPEGKMCVPAPRRPDVIVDALPGRFEMVYEGAMAVDRIDHGQGDR